MTEQKESGSIAQLLAEMDDAEPQTTPTPVKTTEVSAPSPYSASIFSPAPDTLWPGNIPGTQEALSVLREESSFPESQKVTHALQSALPDSVRASLQATGSDSTAVLREAVICCWRLEIAKTLAPDKGPLDSEAAEKILAQVDSILGILQPPAGSPPEYAKEVSWLRKVLTKSAVDFSEILQKLAKEQARAAAQTSAQKFQAPKAKITISSFQAGPTSHPGKKESISTAHRPHRILKIALGLVCLVAIGFHTWRYTEKRARRASVTSPLPGTMRLGDPHAEIQLFTPISNQPLDPSKISSFQSSMENQGKAVREINPGQLMVMPIELAKQIDQIQGSSENARKQP